MPYEYKTDIAQKYFPDVDEQSAMRLLNREIHGTRGLLEALNASGYNARAHRLTPRQVEILYRYLGEP